MIRQGLLTLIVQICPVFFSTSQSTSSVMKSKMIFLPLKASSCTVGDASPFLVFYLINRPFSNLIGCFSRVVVTQNQQLYFSWASVSYRLLFNPLPLDMAYPAIDLNSSLQVF